MEFMEAILSTPWVQTILSATTGAGMVGILAVVLKLLNSYAKHKKGTDAAVRSAEAALALLQVKETEVERVSVCMAKLQTEFDNTQKLLQLLLLNAKNPALRARAAELVTQGVGNAAKELIGTVDGIDAASAVDTAVDQVSAMIAALTGGDAG